MSNVAIQPVDEMQPVDNVQPVDDIQPVDGVQPAVDERQPVDEMQPVDNVQPVDDIQLVDGVQPAVDERQPVDEIQPVDEMSDDSQEHADEISTSIDTSNDAIQPVDDGINLVDEISSESKEFNEWVVNIGAQLDNQFSDPTEPLQPDSNSEQMPSIFFRIMKPRMVYFGEYLSRETPAWKFVAFMRANFGLDVSLCLKDIHEKKDLVLSYYQTDEKFCCSKDFLEYLLINSCIFLFAILFFQNIWNKLGEKRTDPRDQRYPREFNKLQKYIREDPMFFKREMVSMDCQIPWFVVKAVYEKHSNLSKLVDTPIDKLALSCFDDLYPRVHKSRLPFGTFPQGGFKHLLHIFHWTRTPQGKFQVETLEPIKMMDEFYIPGATDLKISATVFKKHAGGSIDVSYHNRILSGVMQLAPWHILDYSIKIYRDLLTFEWVYGELCGVPITAYVACMVCLLQTEEDVKLLRVNGIIPSTRDDEKEVLRSVKEFKELICDDVPMSNDLYDLSKKIRAHHESRASRYYAEFKSTYCGNPFITISVLAAVFLFFLTFIQIVIQVVFSTLTYFLAQKTYNKLH